MVALANSSIHPAFGFEHKLLVGNPYYIVILKQSFKLQENGKLKELVDQIDIRLHDEVKENARWDSVRYPSDLIPYKPKPEVILNGFAHSTSPNTQWICGIDIKQLRHKKTLASWSKQVVVTGSQYWLKQGSRWALSKTEPVTKVNLSFENAYGGHFIFDPVDIPTDAEGSHTTSDIFYPLNPAGTGWLPNDASIKTLPQEYRTQLQQQLDNLEIIPAPQIFSVDESHNDVAKSLQSPYQAVQVAGFGSYANFWQMRTQYLSDDLDWSKESADGGYPIDFDMRHWQQAPADQWLDFELKGDEILTLTGFFQEGKQSYTLPTSIAYVVIREPEKLLMKLDMSIDTLIIDTDKRTLEIVWRRIVLLSHLDPDTIIECQAFTTNEFKRL